MLRGRVGNMERSSLDDMLAGIPSELLDQKIESEIHLVDISKSLVGWEKATVYLGLTRPEEEAIRRDNPLDCEQQRLVLRALKRVVNRIIGSRLLFMIVSMNHLGCC